MAVLSLVMAAGAVSAAVLWRFPYWYTPFTIGSFLFFDRVSEHLNGRSTFQMVARQGGRALALMYAGAAGLALVVDVVYARILAGAWVYPPWPGLFNIAVPILFHYPFGMLSLYATFRVVEGILERLYPKAVPAVQLRQSAATPAAAGVPGARAGEPVSTLQRFYAPLSLVGLALCVAAPLVNFRLNANQGEVELLFVVMLVSTVAFDGAREALTGNSMLRELLAGGRRYGAAIVLTLAWAVVVNEGPNVFAQEWTYLVRPFGLPLWLILALGWPFLLSVSAAMYETAVVLTAERDSKILFRMEASNADRVVR